MLGDGDLNVCLAKKNVQLLYLYLQRSLKVIDIYSNGSVSVRSKFVLFNTDRMFEVCRVGI